MSPAVHNLYTATAVKGLAGGALPRTRLAEDDLGVSGAAGSMSTARDWGVAQQYAGKGAAIVVQPETEWIDRGDGLSELSQYLGEEEVCVGPLTSLQVVSTAIDGPTFVVSIVAYLKSLCTTN